MRHASFNTYPAVAEHEGGGQGRPRQRRQGNNYDGGHQNRRPATLPRQPRNNGGGDYWLEGSETLVHFHKSFGVMQELFDHRDFTTLAHDLQKCALDAAGGAVPEPRFLDLGCAPGGFGACLLQDSVLGPNSVGFGVSLPPQLGGFQMAFASDRFVVQMEDFLGLHSIDLLAANNSIDFCVADAQYLKNMSKCEKVHYRGLMTRSRTLGIWALTVKECQLAFAKLRQNGSFVFRFGWRGVGGASPDVHPTGEQVHPSLLAKYIGEEEWYRALTHWLFSVLRSLFTTLRPFKSEYVHQADVSFYMVCRNFDRSKYERHNWEEKLQRAFDELSNCDDEAALAEGIREGISDETKAEIDELLEVVGRMRAIGIESRKITKPEAAPPPPPPPPPAKQPEPQSPEATSSDAECSRARPAPPGLLSDASTAAEEGCPSSASSTAIPADAERRPGRPGREATAPQAARARSHGRGKGLKWKAVKPGRGAREAQQREPRPPPWHPSCDVPPSCYQDAVLPEEEGMGAWSGENMVGTAFIDDPDPEYSRHMHMSRFRSELEGRGFATAGDLGEGQHLDQCGAAWVADMSADVDPYTWMASCGMECPAGMEGMEGMEVQGHLVDAHEAQPWQPPTDAWLRMQARQQGQQRPVYAPTPSASTDRARPVPEVPAASSAAQQPLPAADQAAAAATPAAGSKPAESESSSSEEEGGAVQRKPYRHKKRAGRVVRERRMTRRRRNAFSLSGLLSGKDGRAVGDHWESLKLLASDSFTELGRAKLYLHAMRFGLFCAMAWSMNSIIFSALRMNSS